MTTISNSGFNRTRLDERLAQLQALYLGIYGADIDLSPSSTDGQFLGALAEAFADSDELAEEIWAGRSPSGATAATLSRLVGLNGVQRKQDQFSTVPLSFSGTPGTTIPAGSLVSNPSDPTVVFSTDNDITIDGSGTVPGTATATAAGPVLAVAGILTNILTVVPGWASVTNTTDATPGSLGEQDGALRIRRARSVALPSQSMADSLYSTVAQLANVTSAAVYENSTGITDVVTGLPAHSFNVIVSGGAPVDIWTAIWLKRPVGSTQIGAQVGTVIDAQGFSQSVKFDRPTPTPIYVTVRLSAAVSTLVANQIIAALAAQGVADAAIGRVVPWADQFSPVLTILAGLGPGAPRIVQILFDDVASPASQADVALARTAIDSWDNTPNNAGRILVTT